MGQDLRVTVFGATGLLGKALTAEWGNTKHNAFPVVTAVDFRDSTNDPFPISRESARNAGDQVIGLGSQAADIRDARAVTKAVTQSRPDWIVLAAAYTDVDGCESNRELAFAVNTQGAVNVAQAANEVGARLLFVSTDYVFDGQSNMPYEADHPRAPRSV